jgi:hypothetical protein
MVDGFPRQQWPRAGRYEEYIIERMGHGTPISAAETRVSGKRATYAEVGD